MRVTVSISWFIWCHLHCLGLVLWSYMRVTVSISWFTWCHLHCLGLILWSYIRVTVSISWFTWCHLHCLGLILWSYIRDWEWQCPFLCLPGVICTSLASYCEAKYETNSVHFLVYLVSCAHMYWSPICTYEPSVPPLNSWDWHSCNWYLFSFSLVPGGILSLIQSMFSCRPNVHGPQGISPPSFDCYGKLWCQQLREKSSGDLHEDYVLISEKIEICWTIPICYSEIDCLDLSLHGIWAHYSEIDFLGLSCAIGYDSMAFGLIPYSEIDCLGLSCSIGSMAFGLIHSCLVPSVMIRWFHGILWNRLLRSVCLGPSVMIPWHLGSYPPLKSIA
jgi:hypothetical protein